MVPQGVVTGRVDADGQELPRRCSPSTCSSRCPTAASSHGLSADALPSLVDAMVVLLVRLHLADFYWGDVALNVLFRRSAGGFRGVPSSTPRPGASSRPSPTPCASTT